MIGSVYERANKIAYTALQTATAGKPGSDLAPLLTNNIFPSMIQKVSETITRPDRPSRRYNRFKIPLDRYGAITEYIMSNMSKADDAVDMVTGTAVDDHVIINPDLPTRYANINIKANYGLTLNAMDWYDVVQRGDLVSIARLMGISMQALYDGIEHDHDSFIPALIGSLYRDSPESSKRTIPRYTGVNIQAYSEEVFTVLNKAIRDLTQWRRKEFNIPGADMVDTKEDLVLVSFDNPVGTNDASSLDIITSRLNIGALARATALGSSLGVEVYEMPTPGIVTSSVARAYGFPKLPGMQTADTLAGVQTKPYPNLRFALIGRGALNVGLKHLMADTSRSSRGHFDQVWVLQMLQLAYGMGQAIFFEDEPEGGTLRVSSVVTNEPEASNESKTTTKTSTK